MTSRWFVICAASFGICAIAASALPGSPLFIWNLTPSVPRGLYQLEPEAPIEVTSLVAAIPPEPLATALDVNRYLPRGVPLLKRVLALPGQRVCRFGTIITVDGLTFSSAVQMRDSRGRPLPSWHGCHSIADDEVFLMNWESDDSLDGRYFGILPRSAIVARAIAVWTDEAADGHFVWRAERQ